MIRNATVIAMDDAHGSEPFSADILVGKGRILKVGHNLVASESARVIEGSRRLAIPGLVNAHFHSSEYFQKARYRAMPFDAWGLYAYPIFEAEPLEARAVYVRSMLAGMEAMKSGVTCVLDDVAEDCGWQELDSLRQVFRAYDDLGLRASVSGNAMDRHQVAALPHAKAALPPELWRKFTTQRLPAVKDYMEFSRAAIRSFHRPNERLRYVVAPVAPQWCTEEMLLSAMELCNEYDLNFHIHALETRQQVLEGNLHYGGSLLRYMDNIGVLTARTTLAHAVWVNEVDTEVIAAKGTSIVHCPITNLKLGVGLAPYARWRRAGVNVGLGTDGVAANDSARLLDVMRFAALVHTIWSQEPSDWPAPEDILKAATIGGARCALVHDQVGSIEVGKRADIVLLNTDTLNFITENDPRNHLVYCENGSSVEMVMIEGKVVVEHHRVMTADEDALRAEFRELLPSIQRRQQAVEQSNRAIEPYFLDIHRRCAEDPVPERRFLSEPCI